MKKLHKLGLAVAAALMTQAAVAAEVKVEWKGGFIQYPFGLHRRPR